MTRATVFVTGGGGYVGSHTVLELLKEDYEVIVVDNFVNAVKGTGGGSELNNKKPESIRRIEEITEKSVTFYEIDLQKKESIAEVFRKHNIDFVIHFAALKAVGESVQIPLTYYRNNVGGTVNLLEVMKEAGVKKLIFSSSATVYGQPQYLPIDERHPVGQSCTNPYGRTKYFSEEIMRDVCNAEEGWSVFLLRYFNPVGAHPSGLLGEDPQGTPNNLMPYISQVAVGRRAQLSVYGGDYDTVDGTGVRDYIHVVDLAVGHVAALRAMARNNVSGCKAYNLGTGHGYSVLEVIKAFAAASGKEIPHTVVARRAGDVASMYADPSFAEKELCWKAEKSLLQMCEDTWRWQSRNPNGFSAGSPANRNK